MRYLALVLALCTFSGCSLFQSDAECALVEAMKKSSDKLLPQYREYVKSEKLASVKQARNQAADEFEKALNDLHRATCGEGE